MNPATNTVKRVAAAVATTSANNPATATVKRVAAAVVPKATPVIKTVSRLGWTVLATGVVAWVVGGVLGWAELIVVGLACLFTVALCILLTIGRTRLTVRLELNPRRVIAGNPAAGRMLVSNSSRARLLPVLLELPIGVSRAQFPLRRLRMGEVQEELFSLATTRRGVVPVGPASTVRGDPFGLLRRTVPWSELIELMVHPRTVAIESLGAGVLRDLEGQTTNEVSTSDLAFHTLREYAPGDDRRYIHWRSSARATAMSGESTLLIRQFLDTRRSHLCTLVDGRSSSYLDEIDFETAISVAASVVRRAYDDDVDTTVLAAQSIFRNSDAAAALAMDAFSRAELGQSTDLSTMARHAVQIAPETTVALIATGAKADFAQLQRAAMYFPPEVNVVAIRVDPTEPAGVTEYPNLLVLSLPQLSGLRALLSGSNR